MEGTRVFGARCSSELPDFLVQSQEEGYFVAREAHMEFRFRCSCCLWWNRP